MIQAGNQMQNIEGLFYLPNFITKDQEVNLVEDINENKWNTDLKRRTQHYGYQYSYAKANSIEKIEKIPVEFQPTKTKIQAYVCQHIAKDYLFDQLIINQYQPGQGISAHTDNKLLFQDIIVSLSLHSDSVMIFEKKNCQKIEKTLKRRSLLILSGESRLDWKHSIPARKKDNGVLRGIRYSMTFRKIKHKSENNDQQ